jgi:hypothetical protein
MNKVAQNNVNFKLSDLDLDQDSDFEDFETVEDLLDQPQQLVPLPKL